MFANVREPSRAELRGLLFVLGMTEVMPLSLVSQALPVVLRKAGASFEQISTLYLAMIPWALKFLWAPVIDRFGSARWGRYRSWLLALHPALLFAVLALGAWEATELFLTRLDVGIPLLVGLTAVAATADTASHGLAVVLLSAEERGAGSGYQIAGTMAGSLIGGGALLMLLDRIGWRGATLIVAASVFVPIVLVWRIQEPPSPTNAVSLRAALEMARRPGIWRWAVTLGVLGVGSSVHYAVMQGMLVDRGLSYFDVGLVLGGLSSAAGVAGGALGGAVTQRFTRRAAYRILGLLAALTMLPLAMAARSGVIAVQVAIAAAHFGPAALSTLLSTSMMDRARRAFAGSDYSAQYCTLHLVSFVGMWFGGQLATGVGPQAALFASPLILIMAVPLGLSLSALDP